MADSLNDLLAQAMAKRAEDRPHSALALAQRLQDIQTQLGFAPTPIEVLDAGPEADEHVEGNGGTRIRPVKIELPAEIAERGTRLRPKLVRPPVIEDHTRQRPPAPQDPDTTADPDPVPAPGPGLDVTSPPPGEPTDALDDETRPRGSRTTLVLGGVGATVLAGVVGIALLAGDPAAEPPGPAPPTPPPTVLGDYVPPPTDFRARALDGGTSRVLVDQRRTASR